MDREHRHSQRVAELPQSLKSTDRGPRGRLRQARLGSFTQRRCSPDRRQLLVVLFTHLIEGVNACWFVAGICDLPWFKLGLSPNNCPHQAKIVDPDHSPSLAQNVENSTLTYRALV